MRTRMNTLQVQTHIYASYWWIASLHCRTTIVQATAIRILLPIRLHQHLGTLSVHLIPHLMPTRVRHLHFMIQPTIIRQRVPTIQHLRTFLGIDSGHQRGTNRQDTTIASVHDKQQFCIQVKYFSSFWSVLCHMYHYQQAFVGKNCFAGYAWGTERLWNECGILCILETKCTPSMLYNKNARVNIVIKSKSNKSMIKSDVRASLVTFHTTWPRCTLYSACWHLHAYINYHHANQGEYPSTRLNICEQAL